MTSRTRSLVQVNRFPFFYGWVVWAAATWGIIATSPGQSYSVSLFMDHFIADLGLDRTTVSSLYGIGTFAGALSLTFVGRAIDRHGNRTMGVLISAMFVVVLLLFSLVTGPFMLVLAFVGIRGLGQGSLGLVSSTAVAQWFQRLRGRVSSLSIVMLGLFQAAYVPGVQRLLEHYDWRQVWIMLGVGVGLTTIPLTWLLIRDRPEDFGLHPDGDIPVPLADGSLALLPAEDNWTLTEAMRTPLFWVFAYGRMLPGAWVTGLVIHQISIFEGLGHDARTAAATYSLMALLSAGVALGSGVAVDRLRPGLVMAFQLTLLCAALGMAMIMTTPLLLKGYALLLGLAMGSGAAFDGAVWANLFGRANLGAIRGFVATAMVTGSAIGPVVFGASKDMLGSYDGALIFSIAACVLGVVASLLAPPPQRPAVMPPALETP